MKPHVVLHELRRRRRYPGGLQRLDHRPLVAQQGDELVDDGGVGARLEHALDIEFEVADEAAAQLVALLDEHDVVDEPAAAGRTRRYPRDLDAGEAALQGLEQRHEVPHREDVVLHEGDDG
jgi:hypothetical protein